MRTALTQIGVQRLTVSEARGFVELPGAFFIGIVSVFVVIGESQDLSKI